MTDKPEDKFIPTDPNLIETVFVNYLAGSGHLHGVANFTFATFNFTPTGDGVESDPVVSCRLRMDLSCVEQLRDACETIIQQNLKPQNGTTH